MELFAIKRGAIWWISVGPHEFSQSVGTVFPNEYVHGHDAERLAHQFAAAPDMFEAVEKIAALEGQAGAGGQAVRIALAALGRAPYDYG